MYKLVCLTGLSGAGKSVAAEYFIKKGYQYVRFGQIVLDEVVKRGLKPIEKNERPIREELRKKYGMAAMAKLNLPKLKKLLKKGNVMGDGIYSFEEYKVLKKEFGKRFITVAIYAPPKLRYERLAKRTLKKGDKQMKNRPASKKEAKSRDYAELENLNKGGTIAMADYTIINIEGIKELRSQIKRVFQVLS